MSHAYEIADLGQPLEGLTWIPGNVEVIWLSGQSGSGKSLISHSDGAQMVPFDLDLQEFLTWRGYPHSAANWRDVPGDVIALDNLDDDLVPYDKVIQLLDAISNGNSPLCSDVSKVYLISRCSPYETFRKEMQKNGNVHELLRRISRYITLDKKLPNPLNVNEGYLFLKQYVDEEKLLW